MPDEDAKSAYKDWINSLHWQFAKTYADDGPHEYIIRDWDSVSEDMFVAFASFIQENGYGEIYGGNKYTCLDIGDHKYWTMGKSLDNTKIINRRSYEGYDVITELVMMGEDPSEYVDIEEYNKGEKYGAAENSGGTSQ